MCRLFRTPVLMITTLVNMKILIVVSMLTQACSHYAKVSANVVTKITMVLTQFPRISMKTTALIKLTNKPCDDQNNQWVIYDWILCDYNDFE